jgi:SOS-response transcriptional repressor LexA
MVYDLCDTIEIDTNSHDAYIAIQMTNNDFAPVYCKGDIILFENRFPQHAEYAAFLIADRIYLRKYLEEGKTYRLQCLHKHGEDIVLKRMDEADYIGTIIGVVRE